MADGTRSWTAAEARSAFALGPGVRLKDLAPAGAIVVVAPHPDDETLGCGGLIAEARLAGRRTIIALMTDGAASHPGSSRFDAEQRRLLRAGEMRAALRALADCDVEVIVFGGSDGDLADRGPEAAHWLQALIERTRAATLFVTWDADPHADHKAAFEAASSACAATGAALWAYPIWSLILPDDAVVGPARRTVKLDVSAHHERKRAAIACYASQLDADVMLDPEGFLLRPEDVARHLGDDEVFLEIRQAADEMKAI